MSGTSPQKIADFVFVKFQKQNGGDSYGMCRTKFDAAEQIPSAAEQHPSAAGVLFGGVGVFVRRRRFCPIHPPKINADFVNHPTKKSTIREVITWIMTSRRVDFFGGKTFLWGRRQGRRSSRRFANLFGWNGLSVCRKSNSDPGGGFPCGPLPPHSLHLALFR